MENTTRKRRRQPPSLHKTARLAKSPPELNIPDADVAPTVPPLSSSLASPVYTPMLPAIQDVAVDPIWGPVLQHVADKSTVVNALYCAYMLMGWGEYDAYCMANGDAAFESQRPGTVPYQFRAQVRPWMAFVIGRLYPHRLWLMSRATAMVDNTAVKDTVRGGLLRTMLQYQTDLDRSGTPPEQQPVHLNPASDASKFRSLVDDAIKRNGALIALIPPDSSHNQLPPPAADPVLTIDIHDDSDPAASC